MRGHLLSIGAVAVFAIRLGGAGCENARGYQPPDDGGTPEHGAGVRIRSAATGECLTAPPPDAELPDELTAEPCLAASDPAFERQWFEIGPVPSSPNDLTLRSTSQNQCLEAPAAAPGAAARLSACVASPFDPTALRQLWRLDPSYPAGSTQICRKPAADRVEICLQAPEMGRRAAVPLHRADPANARQRWILEPDGAE